MTSESNHHPTASAGAIRYVHVPTPGDHFSPTTGSAVPTVIDGLSRAGAEDDPRSVVVVARGTYQNRYDSADIVEFDATKVLNRPQRLADVAIGRLGLGRPFARREWSRSLVDQARWPASIVLGHNAPQLMPSIDTSRHQAVLYAHNELLQSYTHRESVRSFGTVSHVICVSDFLADKTEHSLPAGLAARVSVVPNGVDCEQFFPREDPTRGENLRVLYVGRTIEQKGPDVLLEALGRLDRADISLRVVGSFGFDPNAPLSTYEQSLRELAQRLGDRAVFLPTRPRSEVPALLRDADVMVVPSRWDEPFGLTVMEGMATGIPVIASTVGGIPQAMGDAGIPVPPNDPDALAEAISELADDESLRRRIGHACRKHATQHDWHWARSLLDRQLQSS